MLKQFFPILSWIPKYKRSYLSGDIFAGITVGIMLIPQGMAYALIAGVPPVYGLYAAIVPQLVYALMGTSRQLSVGPVAMDSLLVAAGLGTLSLSSPEEYVVMAIALAFFVGVIHIILGLFRMGFFVRFLSRPVISGFTTAAALIIGASQLQHLLGIQVVSTSRFDLTLIDVFRNINSTNYMALSIGSIAIGVLYVLQKRMLKIPIGLLVVVAGILFVTLSGWDQKGLAIVGEIPKGLPAFKLPNLSYNTLVQLFPIAITLAVVSIMEAMAIAKIFENKNNDHKLNANQELIALGTANILGSFFQSYSVNGGLSRSAVNEQAGAKTGISALISALLVACVLLFFTTLFYKLPNAILAAIIMVAVFRLIDLKYPLRLYKTRKDEFTLFLMTCFFTLFLGIIEGLLIGVLFSLFLVVFRNSKPHYAFLAKIKNTDYFQNIQRFPNDAIENKHLVILRFDAQLFFGNVDYLKKIILNKIQPETKGFILSAEAIHHIDSTAVEQLLTISQILNKKGIRFMVAGTIDPVREVIFKSKLFKQIGKNNFFITTSEAVKQFEGTQ